MTNKNPNSGPEPEADPLTATAMFLKAFETDRHDPPKAADPFAPAPPSPPAAAPPSRPAPPMPSGPGAEPGEFTQLFNSLGPRPHAPQPPSRETPPPPVSSPGGNVNTQVMRGPQAPADQGAGEFTRIFVPGKTPPPPLVSRPSEEPFRPAPPASGPSKSKGFSSPGTSDSASADGSFTQVFRNAGRLDSPRPAAPPTPPPPAPAAPPANAPWKNDPFFSPVEKTSAPSEPSASVTSILSSLAGPGTPPPRTAETAPYRPDPLPSYAPPKPAEEAGGVTRLIQRLAQEPVAPAPAPAPAAPPPPSSEEGEFTRIISGLGSRPAAAPPPAPPPPPPAAAAPAFAIPVPPALPPMPKAPPMPAAPAPHAHAPAPHAPAPPAFAAPVIPPLPKPAPPALPAIAPPKGKLEAMVPILLVINTFLLVILLVVVIFLIKGK